mgnify:CR=1 FL=1
MGLVLFGILVFGFQVNGSFIARSCVLCILCYIYIHHHNMVMITSLMELSVSQGKREIITLQ